MALVFKYFLRIEKSIYTVSIRSINLLMLQSSASIHNAMWLDVMLLHVMMLIFIRNKLFRFEKYE